MDLNQNPYFKNSFRCNSEKNLEVHHINENGSNDLNNAQVLCHECHVNTSSYGRVGHSSPTPFTDETKEKALRRAGYRCEYTDSTYIHNRILQGIGLQSR